MALVAAGQVAGVHAVTDASGLLPIASPYVWSAHKAGRVLTLLGSIPSESFRNSIFAAARRALPKAEIHDEMKLARGAPTSFTGAVNFALGQLTNLAEGTVMLTDSTLSVVGVAASAAAYGAVRTALGEDLGNTVALGPVEILPARADPFVWSASYDGKAVIMAGYVPNDGVRDALVATARATLPGVQIDDRMALASGEPDGFVEAATFAITTLDRFTRGGVTLDGLSLDVAGAAKTVDDFEAVLANLRGNLPTGVQVVSSAIEPASVSPYGWRAVKDENSVILSGYVPSAQDQAKVEAAAKELFSGVRIENRIRVAAGAPDMDWMGAITFALGELGKLSHGAVVLGDKTIEINGEAATPQSFADLLADRGRPLPASLTLAKSNLVPPAVSPYRFVVEREPDGVRLSGYVASADERRAVLDAVARKFGSEKVIDDLAFASGQPEGLVQAVTTSLQAISRLAGGRAEIVDNSIKLTGWAYYPAAIEEVPDAAAASLPNGFVVSAKVDGRQGDQPVPAKQCSDMLQSVLKTGRIAFEGNKAVIAPDSFGLLDRVAETLARCPDAQIEIGAYSDSQGSASRNRDSTQARADVIVDYLVTAGIKRERLSGVGYGESKPIADNHTAQGRAANRRIEFTVKLPEEG